MSAAVDKVQTGPFEVAPPERSQHDTVVLESIWATKTIFRSRTRVRNPCQLDKLYHRPPAKDGTPVLSQEAYLAGMRVAYLYGAAGMHQRTISRYSDALVRGEAQNSAARRSDAYHQWKKAMQLATFGGDVVWEVCCMDQPPGGVARMEILRRALEFLYDRHSDWWGGTVDDSDLIDD